MLHGTLYYHTDTKMTMVDECLH